MTKPPSIPAVGLRADELLKMRGRSRDDILFWPSEITGEDDQGLLANWEYADCTVHIHYRGGVYRVAGVTMKESDNANTD